MSEQLFINNHLKQNNQKIWLENGQIPDFGYTDGDIEESYVLDVLKASRDISTTSLELETQFRDWSSLYHLSTKRANLLRGLNLNHHAEKSANQPALKILEIGCGCGAITRYLGEQGHQVHSVEGSYQRALIARERCRDLANVEVICANATTLNWGENDYDWVMFVGVLEYAGRFISAEVLQSDEWDNAAHSHENAVHFLLQKTQRAITETGSIFISIENRLGLKYQLGADEDHYGKPYVGIHNYVSQIEQSRAQSNEQPTVQPGVKTYTKNEWRELFKKLNLQSSFYYPFPDYKLPTSCLYEPEAEDIESFFNQIQSYDPTSNWRPPLAESALWQAAYKEGYVDKVANSFAIIANKDSLQGLFSRDYDIFESPLSAVKLNFEQHWLSALKETPTLEQLNTLLQSHCDALKEANKVDQLSHDFIAFLNRYSGLILQLLGGRIVSWQELISEQYQLMQVSDVDTLIKTALDQLPDLNMQMDQKITDIDFKHRPIIHSQLFWAGSSQPYNEASSITQAYPQHLRMNRLSYCLRSDASQKEQINNIRFDPCDHQFGIAQRLFIKQVTLYDAKDQRIEQWDSQTCRQKFSSVDVSVIHENQALYHVTGVDPQLIFNASKHVQRVDIDLQWLA